jgi:hypothetical protein
MFSKGHDPRFISDGHLDTLVLSISDRKEPDPPRVEAGNLGRWRRNPKNGTQAAFVVVPVLDVVGSSSLIREPAGLPVWVPNRNIFPTTIPVPSNPRLSPTPHRYPQWWTLSPCRHPQWRKFFPCRRRLVPDARSSCLARPLPSRTAGPLS